MGSDRYWETRDLAQNNFWPARALLERTARRLKSTPNIDPFGFELLRDIEEFLERTAQRS